MPNFSNESQVTFVKVNENLVGQRIDNFLLKLYRNVPKSHIYRIIRSGEVKVNKCRIEINYRLIENDNVRIPPIQSLNSNKTNKFIFNDLLPLPILFEDKYLIALDKPAGIAVHGGSGINYGVIEQIRFQRPNACFLELVHRLDRDTSGILLLAKKRSILLSLHEQLRNRKVDKRYLACVVGKWYGNKQVIVNVPLKKILTPSGGHYVKVCKNGQEACSIFQLRESFINYSLVEAKLKTGRTHQIRAHLAHIGNFIVGDYKYNNYCIFNKNPSFHKFQNQLNRMFLHATYLSFFHPVNKEVMHIHSKLPVACELFLKKLRRNMSLNQDN